MQNFAAATADYFFREIVQQENEKKKEHSTMISKIQSPNVGFGKKKRYRT